MYIQDSPLKYLIVEDRRIDELGLLNILSKYSHLKFLKTATTHEQAAFYIKECTPDIIFMDIEFPGGNGIDLIKIIENQKVIVVFITAHPEYALEGFELAAIDYILKPISEERFAVTHKRIMDYWYLKNLAEAQLFCADQENITIKEGYKKIVLQVRDICYLEAMQDYTKVVTTTRKYMVNTTLAKFLSEQKPQVFIRIHRSYALPKQNIKELHSDKVLGNDFVLPIGKTYRSVIAKLIL